jgi:hypothetical protein
VPTRVRPELGWPFAVPQRWEMERGRGTGLDRARPPTGPRICDEAINMAHGAGGKATHTLIAALFQPAFGNDMGTRRRSRWMVRPWR